MLTQNKMRCLTYRCFKEGKFRYMVMHMMFMFRNHLHSFHLLFKCVEIVCVNFFPILILKSVEFKCVTHEMLGIPNKVICVYVFAMVMSASFVWSQGRAFPDSAKLVSRNGKVCFGRFGFVFNARNVLGILNHFWA